MPSYCSVRSWRRRKAKTKSTTLKQVITSLKDVLKEQEANARVYLACFCTDRDLLSQWRAYGAFGGGYALGFDSSPLYGDEVYERPPLRVLRKVIYNVELQRKVIREWLVAFAQRAARKQRDQLWGDFWQFFSECLSTFKNQAYAEEGEWRLIQFGRHPAGAWEWPMKFRARNGQVVPYADMI